MLSSDAIVIRHAGPADARSLRRLAALDSAPALQGAALMAEVDGEPLAALELATGRVVADPFARTAHLAELLALRAAALRAPDRDGGRLRSLPRRRWRPLAQG